MPYTPASAQRDMLSRAGTFSGRPGGRRAARDERTDEDRRRVVRILLRLAVTALAVGLAAAIFPGLVRVEDVGAAILFALVLGVLNALVRPMLLLLTCPLTLLTLGLFVIVVNAVVFWLATLLPVGVHAEGFGGALVGALTVSIVSLIASRFLPEPSPHAD